MLKLIFANKGSGKTTVLAKLAQKELRKMEKGKSRYECVVSNAPIEGVYYVPDIRQLLKNYAVKNALMLIDEGSVIYNNRKMSITEKEIQWFKLQRHYATLDENNVRYSNDCVIVSQSHEDIDITLRRLYDKMSFLVWLPFVSLERPIVKYLMIDEVTHQPMDGYKFASILSWRFTFRAKWYKYFNSYWVPKDVPVADIKSMFNIMPKQQHKFGISFKLNIIRYKLQKWVDAIPRPKRMPRPSERITGGRPSGSVPQKEIIMLNDSMVGIEDTPSSIPKSPSPSSPFDSFMELH